MAIKRRVRDHARPGSKKDVTVPSFSYAPNDGLAQLIVNAWSGHAGTEYLLQRDINNNPTTTAVQQATNQVNTLGGFNLVRAVVISEEEHDNDYVMQDQFADTEVVFVLPNNTRIDLAGVHLLETAKLLMACTPNGI